MLYAIYRTDAGELDGGVFDFSLKEFLRIAAGTDATLLFVYDFKARGQSYADRKGYVEDKAIEWSNVEKPDLAYSELDFICSGFERLGRQYGLLTDFHENAIC